MTQGRILFLIVRLACSYLLKYAVFDSYQPISCNWYHEMGELFHDGGRYHIETSPLICRANQWTGFYMITASVMKWVNRVKEMWEVCYYHFNAPSANPQNVQRQNVFRQQPTNCLSVLDHVVGLARFLRLVLVGVRESIFWSILKYLPYNCLLQVTNKTDSRVSGEGWCISSV